MVEPLVIDPPLTNEVISHDTDVSNCFRYSVLLAALTFSLASGAFGATKEAILHSFSGQHAANPYASLIADPAGNFYGTTSIGGDNCPPICGTVFELSPSSNGWKFRVIHSFNAGGSDGIDPQAALIRDPKGNLYGTTVCGGSTSCLVGGLDFQGCGTVYELSPNSSGGWDETVIYRFTGTTDGAFPFTALVSDAAGNLYGTAQWGGITTCNPPYGCGTVFELTPNGNSWTFSVIHTFSPNADSGWTESILHHFTEGREDNRSVGSHWTQREI